MGCFQGKESKYDDFTRRAGLDARGGLLRKKNKLAFLHRLILKLIATGNDISFEYKYQMVEVFLVKRQKGIFFRFQVPESGQRFI
jgi:hypothetical protein